MSDLSVNGRRYESASLTADYADGVLTTAHLDIGRGSQTLAVKTTDYNLKTGCIGSAVGKIDSISIPDFWRLFVESPYVASGKRKGLRQAMSRVPRLTSGVVDGDFKLSGCLDSLEGSLKLTARDVGADIRKIDTVTIDASVANGAVYLNDLRAVSGEMVVSATGKPLLANGILQLDVSAQNLDLSWLAPWLGDNTPGGVVAADFVVSGRARAPSIVGSVEVVNPSFHGFAFDRLRAECYTLYLGADRVFGRGYSPKAATRLTPRVLYRGIGRRFVYPRTKPMQLTFDIKKQDLSVLAAFTSLLDTTMTTGSLRPAWK